MQTIVVKLGTSVLTNHGRGLDKAHMVDLVRQCAQLKQQGHRIIIVTSGAIAAGRELLGRQPGTETLAQKQMLAAIGQSQLLHTWQSLFALYSIAVGQMLLTQADLENRERYLNARDALLAILQEGAVPIINENDAVATTQIKVGDNDNLSAKVAILARADTLLLLTDQPGLFTADPRSHPDAELIAEIRHIDDQVKALAGGSGSTVGTGGMATKLEAASIARHGGVDVVISAGHGQNVIINCLQQQTGTRVLSLKAPRRSRKLWLLAGPMSKAKVVLDGGAAAAIAKGGASVLLVGITQLRGPFSRGDVITLCDEQGLNLGKGVARYDSVAVAQLLAHKEQTIVETLGYSNGAMLVHRDDFINFTDSV
ncbi:glutamate 5-kinase [Pseudoalteromonas ruthenica]|uniref:Glutamate 5-kinase n=1 Tax=Pseudoalteromonas ruthenica TaxID=151081 RepID=A0A0F4PW64_9GAMM|nr:glutamate 5-kinase [Pseudoalteromonas ruthenica]KJY96650.1 gamma-glutamyl kinase [Pseudoalteromonas ruthenica]KJY98521.1 gamma-glutamyl kinase [Pseudoalteromonas ruthenica]TLX49332.1 glutamate 5-kinase [Pseudoalteromonas ruthenica]TMO90070.1 glutamate 5-kinase [Pseudoalteromonas ruthenica]TMO91242.1 glutamate 5-kinase [Pseudoalteromonas ruthenica]